MVFEGSVTAVIEGMVDLQEGVGISGRSPGLSDEQKDPG